WFIQQLKPESGAYNIPAAVRLQGAVDVAALRQGQGEIVRRHEVLRTRYVVRDGRPAQVIDQSTELELPIWDLRELVEEEREQLVREIAVREASRPFNLEKGPVWRTALAWLGADDSVLLLSLHHVVSDGWSTGVLIKEFTTLYQAYREGRDSAL